MQIRRLVICLMTATLIPFVVLGFILPNPSWALDAGTASININGLNCAKGEIYIDLDRTPITNDGNSGYDYYRVEVKDNTGQFVVRAQKHASINAGRSHPNILFLLERTFTGSSLVARLFEQSTDSLDEPNGALLASSGAFPVRDCVVPMGIYAPDLRVLSAVRVDTPVYGTPDSSGPVIATLKAGQTWFVTGADVTGAYNQVFLGGPELAWVKASDMSVQGSSLISANSSSAKASSVSAASASVSTMGTATIQAYSLRIRSGPGLDKAQIGLAYQGDKYTVLGSKGVWLSVIGPGGAGWVHGGYVTMKGLSQTLTASVTSGSSASLTTAPKGLVAGVVLAYTLRLRSGPRLSSTQVGMANQNETYTIVGQSANGIWLNVAGPGGAGWVDGSYMRLLGARAQLPVVR